MKLIIEVTPVCNCKVLKVSQVYLEALDVQVSTVPKETEEALVLEASLDHKVNLHCGLSFPVTQQSCGLQTRYLDFSQAQFPNSKTSHSI